MNPYIFMLTFFAVMVAVCSLANSTVSADELYIVYAEATNQYGTVPQPLTAGELGTINAMVYSPIEQRVILTIYVQTGDMEPVGVAILKSTIMEGTTPVLFGFHVPSNVDMDNATFYVNVWAEQTDGIFTYPLAPEFEGENA